MSSSSSWYVRKNGVVHGPASLEDLQQLLRAQQITSNDEAGTSQNGPWQPLAKLPEFAPVRPISELFQSAATPQAPPASPVASPQKSVSPTAERLLASVLNEGAQAASGPPPSPARLEFSQALFKETEKLIENKCFPWAISVGGLTLILLARFNIILALVAAVIMAGITFKVVKVALESKYLDPIEKMSDEMLIARYNELKADARAAKTRSAIGWAVIIVVAVIVFIAWAALSSHG
jgi:hypothetical protein